MSEDWSVSRDSLSNVTSKMNSGVQPHMTCDSPTGLFARLRSIFFKKKTEHYGSYKSCSRSLSKLISCSRNSGLNAWPLVCRTWGTHWPNPRTEQHRGSRLDDERWGGMGRKSCLFLPSERESPLSHPEMPLWCLLSCLSVGAAFTWVN